MESPGGWVGGWVDVTAVTIASADHGCDNCCRCSSATPLLRCSTCILRQHGLPHPTTNTRCETFPSTPPPPAGRVRHNPPPEEVASVCVPELHCDVLHADQFATLGHILVFVRKHGQPAQDCEDAILLTDVVSTCTHVNKRTAATTLGGAPGAGVCTYTAAVILLSPAQINKAVCCRHTHNTAASSTEVLPCPPTNITSQAKLSRPWPMQIAP